ncbi:MAG: Grx4 family monothiol glutaredoxin [SAR324 cluster bacterium]|nr:Grx4 family monothiol glutaredoxin [SAR324 cluster bacterium]
MKFNVVSPQSQTSEEENHGDPRARIESMVSKNPIFLFMKGSPEMPQCGFSAKVCQIMQSWNIPFESFDVLSDHNIREEVKTFSNWPTIPQLYINKDFVGGCDIVTELAETGELLPLLKAAHPDREFTPPPPPAEVKQINPQTAAERLQNQAGSKLLDLRSPGEWETEHVEGSLMVDQELVQEMVSSWDRNTPLMLICYTGVTSNEAAQFFTAQGFQDVSNVEGGMNNWRSTMGSTLLSQ